MLPTVDSLKCYLGNLVLAFEPQCTVMGGCCHDYHQVGMCSQCVVEKVEHTLHQVRMSRFEIKACMQQLIYSLYICSLHETYTIDNKPVLASFMACTE